MPGAVYNDDYALIDASKGIFCTHPVAVPEGYAYELDNFVVSKGSILQRRPIKPLTTNNLSSTSWYGVDPPLYGIIPVNLSISLNSKTLLAVFAARTQSADPRLSLVGIFSNTAFSNYRTGYLIPAASLSGGFAVYNKNLYASCTTGVFKFDVNNFPTSIVETAIASSPTNLKKLLVHKSRLFGFQSAGIGMNTNRLYFTDAPTVGNLPETWNPTVNFIDVNGIGDTTIYDIVSINNYIYIFTDSGLFSLYTQGAPANWSLKPVNLNVSINAFNQVVAKNDLIYYVTEDGVYATDGFDTRLISQAISEYFTGSFQTDPRQYTLGAFNGGLLLKVLRPDVGYAYMYTDMDAIAWSTLNLCSNVNSDAGPDKATYVLTADLFDPGQVAGTVAVAIVKHNPPPGANFNTHIYEYIIGAGAYAIGQDEYPIVVGNNITGTVKRSLRLKYASKELVGTNFMRLKYFKELVLMFGSEFPFTVAGEAWFNGQQYSSPLALPMQSAPNTVAAVSTHSEIMSSLIMSGFSNQKAFSVRFELNIELLQNIPIGRMIDRFPFSLLAMGYISQLERTTPAGGSAGQL